MTLRVKTLLILTAAIASLMLVLHIATSRIVLAGFTDLEQRNVNRNAARAHDAMMNELETLNRKAADWAVWDDTYRFVADHNQEYITANLGDETFVNLQLNLILIIDASHSVVYGKCVDLNAGQATPVPAGLLARVTPDWPLLNHPNNDHSYYGVLLLPDGPVMISARPILQNTGAGPIRGTMIFARFLDQHVTSHLSEITHQHVDFTPLPQTAALGKETQLAAVLSSGGAPVAQIISPTMIAAHFVVEDVLGQPALLGCVELRREIFARGEAALRYHFGIMLLVGAAVAFVICVLLNRLVLAPVSRLRDGVRHVGESGDLTTRVQVRGRDEIADLANEFNRMIQTLSATQRDLTQARDQAQAATRAKSEFLANMSHEIRTPMTAILGYADLLTDPAQSPQERTECAQIIRRNGRHLLEIINDILDMSRIEAGRVTVDPIDCSPRDVVGEVVSLLRGRAGDKGLQLIADFRDSVPVMVHTDPTRLRQVLVNLVSNAIKFTERGEVRINVRIDDSGQTIPARLVFEVADTGIGMTAEQLGRLFQPFTQADNSTTRRFGGTGLGLYICRELAALLNGDISATSEPGRGSVFTLSIGMQAAHRSPDSIAPAEAAQDHAAQRTNRSLAGRRILLAEDGPDNQRLIAFLLRRAGAEVTIVTDGRQAIDAALNPPGLESSSEAPPFDVILMDMQMPNVDGYTAAATLRRRGYTGRIIALTAHAMSGDRERCIDAGCDDYATKPIDAALLIRAAQGASSASHRGQTTAGAAA